MKLNGRHHRLWWHVSDKLYPLCRLWRPYCWVKGHEDSSYGYCVICLKRFGPRGMA